MSRCQATKGDGSPCERIVGSSQRYCYSHDKTRAKERKANASRAGRSKPGFELKMVREQLKQLAQDVLDGHVDRGDGSVAAQILGVYLRAVEQERRQKELDELVGRIELLEQEQPAGRRWPA